MNLDEYENGSKARKRCHYVDKPNPPDVWGLEYVSKYIRGNKVVKKDKYNIL